MLSYKKLLTTALFVSSAEAPVLSLHAILTASESCRLQAVYPAILLLVVITLTSAKFMYTVVHYTCLQNWGYVHVYSRRESWNLCHSRTRAPLAAGNKTSQSQLSTRWTFVWSNTSIITRCASIISHDVVEFILKCYNSSTRWALKQIVYVIICKLRHS